MFKQALIVLTLAAAAWLARADEPRVHYAVHLDRPQTQTLTIELQLDGIDSPDTIVALPTWRPGRYEILDLASDIRSISAADAAGKPLDIHKTAKSTWHIETVGIDSCIITYELYANNLNDRTRHVDDTHAFLSGAAVFIFSPDRRDEPLTVTLDGPEDWAVATGLQQVAPRTLFAPNYDILVDSPIEFGHHELLQFQVQGVPHEIAIWGTGEWQPDRLRRDVADIVREEEAVFGEFPYDRYVFLLHVQPGIGGGTEHYNSTIMQTRPSAFDTPDHYHSLLGLVAHEFFHTWNVKRFRPAGLSPYDYFHENYTPSLWLAEGTTSYYGELSLARASAIDIDEYLDQLEDGIVSYRARPGHEKQTLAESSYDAWIKFNNAGPDRDNTTVSFYRKGALASLVLDANIRRASNNTHSLDDVMRTLYQRFPHGSAGYTPDDVVSIASSLAGHDLAPLFHTLIESTDSMPIEDALAYLGIEMTEKPDKTPWEKQDEMTPPADRPYLGLKLSGTSVRAVLEDGPAFDAGIIVNDELLAVDGRRITNANFDDLQRALVSGDNVTITFFRRDRLRTITLAVGSKPNSSLRLGLVNDPTPEQKAAFEAWLHQSWPSAEDKPAGEEGDSDRSDSRA